MVALLLVVVAGIGIARPWITPDVPRGVVVEVTGDVPRPGLVAADPPTAARALSAAGADPEELRDVPGGVLREAARLHVEEGAVRVGEVTRPLLVALPIDLNRATAESLAAVPGLGARASQGIVDDREAAGPFREVDDLLRVRGIGADTLERLRPFVAVGEVPRLDLNTATAAELEALPGIGPVLAARIVVDRAERGPYGTVDELVRVPGVGRATLDTLRDRIEVGP